MLSWERTKSGDVSVGTGPGNFHWSTKDLSECTMCTRKIEQFQGKLSSSGSWRKSVKRLSLIIPKPGVRGIIYIADLATPFLNTAVF